MALAAALLALLLAPAQEAASTDAPGDWPTWRYDARRSASSPHALPGNLSLRWVRALPPSRPAWPPTQDKLQFDVAANPVVAGRRIFVPSNAIDAVTAYDTGSGKELWRFFADGPVRFSPVAHGDAVFFVSDDGHLYKVRADNGALLWKVRGGPSHRPVLGHGRLVSSWPARGGPVLHDGRIFFTASIWPFMGIFVHAVDPETGAIAWTNSGDGTNYTVQPHGAPSFATISPQGHLVATGDHLVVPGGRSMPAVFDARTGRMRYFHFDKRAGSHAVVAGPNIFYLTSGAYTLKDGASTYDPTPSVLDEKVLVYGSKGTIELKEADGAVSERSGRSLFGRTGPKKRVERNTLRRIDTGKGPSRVHLRAGPRVYASDGGAIAAYDLSGDKAAWTASVEDRVWTMLAADRKLFVVTIDNRLWCFGEPANEVVRHAEPAGALPVARDAWTEKVAAILGGAEGRKGFAAVLGIYSGRLIDELLRQSELTVSVVDADAARVDALRRKLVRAGHYGSRVTVFTGDPARFPFPPYFADLLLSEKNLPADDRLLEALRPYGGTAHLGDLVKRRNGPLPDTDDWTHQYGNGAQTGISRDLRVKAPFGILWFGGASHEGILPRHGHGPSPQVAGGRLFIEGPDMLRAVDVYTGRVLWEKRLRDLGKYYNTTRHFAGAGEIGSNYVSLPDRVYTVYGPSILELDAATGALDKEFRLEAGADAANWGYLGAWKDTLVATSAPVPVTASKAPKSKLPTDVTPIFDRDGKWRFLAGRDPEGDWTSAGYDDAAWNSGLAGFGYGDGDDRTVLRDMRGNYTRVYIRRTFDLASIPDAGEVGLAVNYDDAFIAYLNGREIARAGVGRGVGAKASKISSHEADGHEYFRIQDWRKLLVKGANVLALEGHNSGSTSSDFSLDPWLAARGGAPAAANPGPAVKAAWPRGRYAPSSRRLVVFDRHAGSVRWTRDAELNFRHNNIALGNDMLFCIDGITEKRRAGLEKSGVRLGTAKPTLYAFDLATGKELWKTREDVFGTFLNYSEEHDILVQAGSRYRDRAADETGKGIVAYRGKTGEVLWKSDRTYNGPLLVRRDTLLTNGSGGMELSLVTGEPTGWTYRRMYGCNTAIGSEHLLTFRSGAAGYSDLVNRSGTGNIGGFRSSCTPNLIPANGVLNAPDYTRTCTCAYQLQVSLALVHMPEAEMWTFGARALGARVGLNLGAPGDRRAPDGTLWLDTPSVGGPSENIDVAFEPKSPERFRVHASTVQDAPLPWVAASGLVGVRRIAVRVGDDALRTVTLHFMEPDPAGPRTFDVSIQGETVLRGFDVRKEAGGPLRGIVRAFTARPRDGRIVIELGADSVVSGIELRPAK